MIPSKQLKKALNLPATYRIRVRVDGYIGAHYHELRMLTSDTGGHVAVYAKSVGFGFWQEITLVEWKTLAAQVIKDASP